MSELWGSWTFRFVLFALLFGAALGPRLGIRQSILWSLGLGAAMAIASGSFRQWAIARRHAQLIQDASGLVSPSDGQIVAVCGVIEADGTPLTSPVYGEDVVAYQYMLYHRESRRSAQRGSSWRRVVDYAGFGAVPASVKGPYFSARLGQFPTLHGFGEGMSDLMNTVREVREQQAAGASLSDVAALARAAGDSEKEHDRARLQRVSRHLAATVFDPVPPGEMIEYVEIMDKRWDGTGRLTRNFRREADEPYDPMRCEFWEQRVAPGTQVCALGTWSHDDKALIGTPRQDLWLYRGTPEEVRPLMQSTIGAAWFFAVLLTVASVATAVYLILRRGAASTAL